MPWWIKIDYCLLKKCLQTPERRTKKEKIIEMEQHDSSVNRFARGGNKHQVLLLVVVSSAPGRCDRRKAIKQTWMSKCDTV